VAFSPIFINSVSYTIDGNKDDGVIIDGKTSDYILSTPIVDGGDAVTMYGNMIDSILIFTQKVNTNFRHISYNIEAIADGCWLYGVIDGGVG